MKIKIIKNGPYLVTGGVKLVEKIIVPKGRGYVWEEGRKLPQSERYLLCRCGMSKNQPFCDGIHVKMGFDGCETASREPFSERADVLKGGNLDLLDDGRCALARFCHRNRGDAWKLTYGSDDPKNREEAIIAASECPAGRLLAMTKEGEEFEPEYEPSIEIIQDPEKGVSGAIFVKGRIPIESSDGHIYEVRNRITLCRCGKSRNKPFCDAMHVYAGFDDGNL